MKSLQHTSASSGDTVSVIHQEEKLSELHEQFQHVRRGTLIAVRRYFENLDGLRQWPSDDLDGITCLREAQELVDDLSDAYGVPPVRVALWGRSAGRYRKSCSGERASMASRSGRSSRGGAMVSDPEGRTPTPGPPFWADDVRRRDDWTGGRT